MKLFISVLYRTKLLYGQDVQLFVFCLYYPQHGVTGPPLHLTSHVVSTRDTSLI